MGPPNTLLQQMQSKLKEWDAALQTYQNKIKVLESKGASLEAEAKANYQKQLDQLNQKIREVQGKVDSGREEYHRLQAAGEEAWSDLKTGAESAWDNLKDGVSSAWEETKKALDSATSKLK